MKTQWRTWQSDGHIWSFSQSALTPNRTAQERSHLLNAPTKNTSRKPGPIASFSARLVTGGFPISFSLILTLFLYCVAILTSKVERKRLLYLLGFNKFNFIIWYPKVMLSSLVKCHFNSKTRKTRIMFIFHGIPFQILNPEIKWFHLLKTTIYPSVHVINTNMCLSSLSDASWHMKRVKPCSKNASL